MDRNYAAECTARQKAGGIGMVLLGVDLVDILWNPATSYEKSLFYFWMFGGSCVGFGLFGC